MTTTVTTRSTAAADADATNGTTSPPATSLVRGTALATVLAAAATEAFTAVVRASGVHLAAGSIGGTSADVAEIGPGACSIMIVIATVAGLLIALGIRRYARRPRRTYVATTLALTVVSFVPDVLAGATSTASKVTLIAAHVIAAAVVIPLVARRLPVTR